MSISSEELENLIKIRVCVPGKIVNVVNENIAAYVAGIHNESSSVPFVEVGVGYVVAGNGKVRGTEVRKHGKIRGKVLKEVSSFIPRSILVEALGSSQTNFSKLYDKDLSLLQTDVMIDLSKTWAELRKFFHDNTNEIKEWISTPNQRLDGIAPSSLLSSIGGRSLLRNVIDEMRHGDFV